MKCQELAGSQQRPYTTARGFGVEKADKAGFENIWFVVPPPPPRHRADTPT